MPRGSKTESYRVRRRGGSYTSKRAPRGRGQKYYPNAGQARTNRRASAKVSASERKKRGTQWRHGRKSKAEVRRKGRRR